MTPTFVTDARFISNTRFFSVVENARFLSCDGQLSFLSKSNQCHFYCRHFQGVPWQNQQVTASSNFSCSLSPAIIEWPLSFCHVSPASSLSRSSTRIFERLALLGAETDSVLDWPLDCFNNSSFIL